MKKIIIRIASPKDIHAVMSIGNTIKEFVASRKTSFHSMKELKEYISRKKDNIFLVAELEKKVVGFLHGKIIWHGWCMIDTVAVMNGYRGRGVGSLIVERMQRNLKKKGVFFIQGLVGESYKRTRKFWKKKGFKEGRRFIWFEKYL